jgi:hypothetical protein
MGLILSVYRAAGRVDCSNNGISAMYNEVCVTNVDGPFEPRMDCPPVVLEKGPFGTVRLRAEADLDIHTMMGGNYAGTSDSRFSSEIKRLTGTMASIAPIHDRVE